MNLDFLKTIAAIADHGTLVSAGEALNLSHSAISLRIKSLEETLQLRILDRRGRPVRLTPEGELLLIHARELERLTNAVQAVGKTNALSGLLRLGAVPTTLTMLVPSALAALRGAHPAIELHVRSGLSGELALALRQGEIDAALLSEPSLPIDDMEMSLIAVEELILITNQATPGDDWQELLRREPYIWFNRKTWAGQQIERHLLAARIAVRGQIEVDSLEAIRAMVRHGLGVAIVPWRRGDRAADDGLRHFDLHHPTYVRRLVLMRRPGDPKHQLITALIEALQQASSSAGDDG